MLGLVALKASGQDLLQKLVLLLLLGKLDVHSFAVVRLEPLDNCLGVKLLV